MSSKTNFSLDDRLRKAGIRHFDVLIHDQPKEWLIKNFSQGADEYPVVVRFRNFGTFRAKKSHGKVRAKFDDSKNFFK